MPAKSKAQQRFMGMVHAIQKGDAKPGKFSKKVREAAKKMDPQDAKDFASTKTKGLPEKKTEKEASFGSYLDRLFAQGFIDRVLGRV